MSVNIVLNHPKPRSCFLFWSVFLGTSVWIDLSEDLGMVVRLVVPREKRGQGIATALIKEGCRYLDGKNIWLHPETPAIMERLYRPLGFKVHSYEATVATATVTKEIRDKVIKNFPADSSSLEYKIVKVDTENMQALVDYDHSLWNFNSKRAVWLKKYTYGQRAFMAESSDNGCCGYIIARYISGVYRIAPMAGDTHGVIFGLFKTLLLSLPIGAQISYGALDFNPAAIQIIDMAGLMFKNKEFGAFSEKDSRPSSKVCTLMPMD